MREKILQKLDDEYELFFLEAMRNSKANLFAKSLEIETKKEVQNFLRDFVRSDEILADEGLAHMLYLSDHLMDECYRFCIDHKDRNVEANCRKYIFQKIGKKM